MKTEEPKTKGARRLFSQFRKVCEGLNYVSETDSNVEPVFFECAGEISAVNFRKALDLPATSRVAEASFDDFFSPLTKARPWHTHQQEMNAEGFAGLETLMRSELAELAVFRVGQVRVEIYAIGRDEEGDWLGIWTEAVET